MEQGLFKGTGEETFSPYGSMTRAMYVTVLGRIAGINPDDYKGSAGFADVENSSYYAPYVAWAIEKGITNGVGNNRFDPNSVVSREQMAALIIRFFEAYEIDYGAESPDVSTPEDLSDVSAWAREPVLKLWRVGLLRGDSNGRFNPGATATRAEAATLSTRTDMLVTAWQEGTIQPSPSPSPSAGDDRNYTYYTVSFDSSGGTPADPIAVISGSTLSNLPTPQKDNAIFIGWYEDSNLLGDPVTSNSVVTGDMTLYAKYLEIAEISEEVLDDSFSLPDQETNLTFQLNSSDSSMSAADVQSAISLQIADGSEPVTLMVSGSNGAYTVQAANGFTPGASYKLTLTNDSLSFSDMGTHVRICSFTIKRAEVFDLQLNNGIIYIPDEHIENIVKDSVQVESLSVPLVTMSEGGAGTDSSTTGTFTYNGNEVLGIGDVLCIYSGNKPELGDDAAYLHDDIAYITVTGIDGRLISFSDPEAEDVLFIPDMLPIYVGDGHNLTDYVNDGHSGSFTTSLSILDIASFFACFHRFAHFLKERYANKVCI